MECELFKTVWFATPLGITFSSNDEVNFSFNEWVSKVVVNEDREVVQLVVAICYEIWRVRNKRCFEGIDIPCALSVCNSACKAIQDFNSAENMLWSVIQPASVPISAVRWTTLITDFYKLNVDVAGPNAEGNWRLAGVIRGTNGMVVAARCWYTAVLPESNVVEGMALLKGMKFAKDMLFLNLNVEADSSNVITAINEAQPQHSYLGSIIEDSESFFSSFHSIDFCHICREVNQAAHYLTKFPILACTDFVVVAFDLLPPSV